jgi:hypothetical protein
LAAAVATVGGLFTITDKFDTLEQAPFVVLQRNTFVPDPIAVTLVVTAFELLITPAPDINDQVPGPNVGEAAESTVDGVLIQIVWLGPAIVVGGIASTWIDMVFEFPLTQALFTDHRNTFNPSPSPVTWLVASVEFAILAVPESTDQEQTPPVSVVAASIVLFEFIHKV